MSQKKFVTSYEKRRLQDYFNVTRMPFSNATKIQHMFESKGQWHLVEALLLWATVRSFALVIGAAGVGKSISIRKFVRDLDSRGYHVIDFTHLPTTTTGFLRSLGRKLDLPPRLFTADAYDDIKAYLGNYEQEQGKHPILVIDDAEGLTEPVLDLLRRLTCFELDSNSRLSVLLSGTEEVLIALRSSSLAPLKSRITFSHVLRPFTLDDTQKYVKERLERVGAHPHIFTEEAIRQLFLVGGGLPRNINQLATHIMINGAVAQLESIDADFVKRQVAEHPLLSHQGDA